MKKALKRLFLVIGFIFAGFLFAAVPARAVSESLTVSPLSRKFQLMPGQPVDSSIDIKNSGEQAIDVELYANLFSIKNENYDQEFNKSDNHLAVSNWVAFDKTNYHLEPKQKVQVNYHVKVPKDAEPGGHYAALFAQTKSPDQRGNDVIEIKRVASLLYFEIAGSVTKSGNIESMMAGFWQKKSPILVEIRLKDSGNTHYRVGGAANLSDVFGRIAGSQKIDKLLLPRTTRLITLEVPTPNWPGLYRLETSVTFPQGKPQVASKWILYAPPAAIIVIAILLALVVGLFYYLYRRRRKGRSLRS